jgi:apolipoprotein N-acyltransferase
MTRAAIAGTIYLSTTVTLYCRIGDLFAWACTGAAIIATLRRARSTVA